MRLRRSTGRTGFALLVLALIVPARLAHADDASEKTEAQAYFKDGLRRVQNGDLDAAIEAFENAYRASPNYGVLYNLGQAYLAVGRRVDAVHTFESFLTQGGDRVSPKRRAEVEALIARERARLATLDLEVSPKQAEVFVDGTPVESASPLARDLDAGHHVIAARLEGYTAEVTELDLQAGQAARVTVVLKPERIDLMPPLEPAAPHEPAPRPLPPTAPAPAVSTHSGLGKERTWALGLGVGGVVVASAAVGIFVWNNKRYQSWATDRDSFNAALANGSSGPAMVSQHNDLTDRAVGIERADDAAMCMAVAAGAALVGATVLWVTSSRPAPNTRASARNLSPGFAW
jgi:hypothetical protein